MSALKQKNINADEFIRNLFNSYLVERDFDAVIACLHENITWIGTGEHEICNDLIGAKKLLEMEKASSNIKFKVVNQWYQTFALSSSCINVYGEIELAEDGINTILLNMHSRFSMICKKFDCGWKLLHAHVSVPNPAQKSGEFVHATFVENYNKLLEDKLLERTALLKEKTVELESLTNNIVGGVQVCAFDNDYSIKFMSNGFCELTGYSKDDFETFFKNKHLMIVHAQDVERIKASIREQLNKGNTFAVEYRINCKNGKTIWVMDKGILIKRDNGEVDLQCILTDISIYKEQEEQLNLSKKRYEIAMSLSDITMFEYDVVTGDLIFYDDVATMYDVPERVPNGVETFISKVIEPVSVPEYREMYRKIHSGVESAKCFVKTRDVNGTIHDFELSLTNVFNQDGKPIRAIGVRKNLSQMMLLQRENEFGKNLAADKTFIFEADLTLDKVEFLHPKWQEKLGAAAKMNYSHLIKQISLTLIKSEFADSFMDRLSPKTIAKGFENGDNIVSFEYKSRNAQNEYAWHEAIINIVKDENSGHLCMRFYRMDISEMKKKEERAFEERRLYESMLSKANRAYEVNVSKNLAIKGHEDWLSDFGIKQTNNYSEMIAAFSKHCVHPEDSANFYNTYLRDNVIRRYKAGDHEICCQYRAKFIDGSFRWASCVFHLYDDPTTAEIKGFSYIMDIDEQKREELTLKFNAEHDTMTGTYNKTTLEKLVNKELKLLENKNSESAFLMIDIDYFKYINDNFGHLYGDNVIKEIAQTISVEFNSGELVGRVGGDEFAVFIPYYRSSEELLKKVDSLCNALRLTYTENGRSFSITASIGIALSPQHGKSFLELFINSDKALYSAKQNGKNKFQLFS